MAIDQIAIQQLTHQFFDYLTSEQLRLDEGAEFVGATSYLVWLKSKALLPQEEKAPDESVEEDLHFNIIHHLIDYCRFKEAAKELSYRQDQQQTFYCRGVESALQWKKPLGIDHISLEELANLFKEMAARFPQDKPRIFEEQWKVSDKIQSIRHMLEDRSSFPLKWLFSVVHSRLECIVIFLALLELMKSGELSVGREKEREAIYVYASQET